VCLRQADRGHGDEDRREYDSTDRLELVDEVIAVDTGEHLRDREESEGNAEREVREAGEREAAEDAIHRVPAAGAHPVEERRQIDAASPEAATGEGELRYPD
jgi:hypothetical protein